MKDINTEKKIAVLIDAENAQYSVLDYVLKELSKHGHILVKKAYGDWSTDYLKNWKDQLNELAINPVQQFSYTQGKNSSDAAMIIDAMDLLYSGKFDAFALVSSDSDFTKLASRLKESQIYVFGVGEDKTPIAFRNACDDFMYTEVIKEQYMPEDNSESNEPHKLNIFVSKEVRNKLRMDTKLVKILRTAVSEYEDEDGWAFLGMCGGLIKRQYPDFSSKNYGFKTLTLLIEATGLFEIQRRSTDAGNHHIYLRDIRK
ncbi:NYN domain-containing protein [Photobacterium leiognathi]|uniref:NYN domain-containing protein n=1 Tax=Photobacterium leiognathi TaxID=553611 RepID=UPI002981E0EB|nr:NYN domain-containing protein [Photobacterium leiognathi]